MKAHYKTYAQFKFCVELDYSIVIPKNIRTWLLVKDSPFDASHILYVNKAIKRHVVAFEYRNDALRFIALMERYKADVLE